MTLLLNCGKQGRTPAMKSADDPFTELWKETGANSSNEARTAVDGQVDGIAGVPLNRYLNPFFSDETEEAEAKQWLVPDNAPLLSILVLKDGKKEKPCE
jgi:hypothetical protein